MGSEIPGVTNHDVSHGYVIELPYNLSAAVGVQFLRGLIGWLWVIGLVGLGRRFLKGTNRVLAHSTEAILPSTSCITPSSMWSRTSDPMGSERGREVLHVARYFVRGHPYAL